MKKFKVTLISVDKKEVYEVDGFFDVVHLVLDIVLIGIQKENVIIQIERVEEKKGGKRMKNTIFSLVSPNRPRRSNFDLSHERKLSCNMGELVPILVMEVVPGDKFKIDTQSLIRFSPLVSPVMHRINAYYHFFYVPNRIIFPDWEKLITGEEQIEVPNFDICSDDHLYTECSLADHMGLPTGVHFSVVPQKINTLPFRAYAKIYNDYYRDENFCPEIDLDDDGAIVKMPVKRRAWAKDYFTSALPWAQKGNPVAVEIDLERNSPTKILGAGVDPLAPGQAAITGVSQNEGILVDNDSQAVNVRDIESAEFNVESLRLAERLQRFWRETLEPVPATLNICFHTGGLFRQIPGCREPNISAVAFPRLSSPRSCQTQ